jgi:hypothetical protein
MRKNDIARAVAAKKKADKKADCSDIFAESKTLDATVLKYKKIREETEV